MSIIIEDIDKHTKCITNGQSVLGEFLRDNDGYWVFYPEANGGFYNEYFLTVLLSALESMNEEWDNEVKEGLEKLGT